MNSCDADAVVDRPFIAGRHEAQASMARLASFEGSKMRWVAEHFEWKLIGQDSVNSRGVRFEVTCRKEELQERTPVVVGRPGVVEAEHVRAASQTRRRVLQIREVTL